MKKAVITGISGQDGAYLAELLLNKGYTVYGTYRRSSSGYKGFWRLDYLKILKNPNLRLVEFDLTDLSSAIDLIKNSLPDEVYNLAAQSFVAVSFTQPVSTTDVNAFGTLNLLEAIRLHKPDAKFYQASTSEMFGKVQETPQTENTPFYPRSPYGIAKLYAHWMTVNYRESYNIFATSGILFNHESPLRGMEFVTKKITSSIAKIINKQLDFFELGNLDAKRDWGYAKEYVVGMWLMLQKDTAENYILATSNTISIRDFLYMSLNHAGVDFISEGVDENEVIYDKKTYKPLVKINKKFYRPAEVDILIGDATKARDRLGWNPETSVEELSKLMMEFDLDYYSTHDNKL